MNIFQSYIPGVETIYFDIKFVRKKNILT